MSDLGYIGGWLAEREDRAWLLSQCVRAELLMYGDLPDKVDPRQSKLAEIGWLRVENQGSIGSCQGCSLTECAEYCYPIATGGKVVQLSMMYAYLRSQQMDGINGDRGSTLSGGTKAAREGICTDAVGPYPGGYPGWGWITDGMKKDAEKYKLKSVVDIKDSEQAKQFIGSGIGVVHIGIAWNGSMSPDSNGCIRSYRGGGGGGHAVVYCGYLPDDLVGQRSSKGYWFLLKNSWGSRWGKGGYAYCDPAVIDQQIRTQGVFLGRSDMETPTPRPLPVDFTKESLLP
jgi:hypothetical protein